MNSKLLALAMGLGWLSVSARADLTVVQDVYYGDMPQRVTVKIKGDKMRVDGAPMGTLIVDAASGDTFVVMDSQKTYAKISSSAAAAKVGENAAAAQFKPTGETARAGDYDTEVYTAEGEKVKAKYWVAKNYPDSAAIKSEYGKISRDFMGSFMKAKLPDTDSLPGIPVKTELTVSEPLPLVINTSLVSISRDALEDALFVIPGGYRLLQIPLHQLMD